jgi:hypothetical protein
MESVFDTQTEQENVDNVVGIEDYSPTSTLDKIREGTIIPPNEPADAAEPTDALSAIQNGAGGNDLKADNIPALPMEKNPDDFTIKPFDSSAQETPMPLSGELQNYVKDGVIPNLNTIVGINTGRTNSLNQQTAEDFRQINAISQMYGQGNAPSVDRFINSARGEFAKLGFDLSKDENYQTLKGYYDKLVSMPKTRANSKRIATAHYALAKYIGDKYKDMSVAKGLYDKNLEDDKNRFSAETSKANAYKAKNEAAASVYDIGIGKWNALNAEQQNENLKLLEQRDKQDLIASGISAEHATQFAKNASEVFKLGMKLADDPNDNDTKKALDKAMKEQRVFNISYMNGSQQEVARQAHARTYISLIPTINTAIKNTQNQMDETSDLNERVRLKREIDSLKETRKKYLDEISNYDPIGDVTGASSVKKQETPEPKPDKKGDIVTPVNGNKNVLEITTKPITDKDGNVTKKEETFYRSNTNGIKLTKNKTGEYVPDVEDRTNKALTALGVNPEDADSNVVKEVNRIMERRGGYRFYVDPKNITGLNYSRTKDTMSNFREWLNKNILDNDNIPRGNNTNDRLKFASTLFDERQKIAINEINRRKEELKTQTQTPAIAKQIKELNRRLRFEQRQKNPSDFTFRSTMD